MRIPTSNFFQQAVSALSQQYLNLYTLYDHEESKKKILAPSDDPVLANRINQTASYMETLDSYTQNGSAAQARMKLFDSSINSEVNYVKQVQELIINAQDETLPDTARLAIAEKLQGLLSSMVNTINTPDASGLYIYSGSNTNVPPFALVNGNYVYQGNNTQSIISIGPNATAIYNESGANVFGNIALGNGNFTVSANSANTGNGATSAGNIVNSASYVPDTYTLTFATNSAGETVYSIVGAASGQVVPAPPATIPNQAPVYTVGQNMTFNGISFDVKGTPNAGDSFQIAPSANQDMFDTLQTLINALKIPINTNAPPNITDPAKLGQLRQALSQASASFTQISNQLIAYQSTVGTREGGVNEQVSLNKHMLDTQTDIWISLAIIDPVQITTEISQQTAYLKAAQGAYMLLQNTLLDLLKM